MVSILDRLYARVSNRRLFFREGWGDRRMLEAAAGGAWDSRPVSAEADLSWQTAENLPGVAIRRGSFPSPAMEIGLPEESRVASFEMVLPAESSLDTPLCIHFAATGDEGFSRRRIAIALPLVKVGIGSVILENPYYGSRRPAGQQGKMLRRVSDLWKMGAAAVAEGTAIVRRLRREGYRRLGVAGISMGGSMAAQTAAMMGEPLAVICFITAHSASAVFTEGILSRYLAWDFLQRELDGRAEAVAWMRQILSRTDVRSYPPPALARAAVLVGARCDAYIPAESVRLLHAHWPGSTLHWMDTGHIGAFLFHRQAFLQAAIDAFRRLES